MARITEAPLEASKKNLLGNANLPEVCGSIWFNQQKFQRLRNRWLNRRGFADSLFAMSIARLKS